MRVKADVEVLNADAVQQEILTEILKASKRAVRLATRSMERDLEAQTRRATGGNAWRAWKSEVYPRGEALAYEPSGTVRANGGKRSKGMLNYWSLPGVNRARGGTYLAVPLKAALGTYHKRHISPRQWEGIFKAKLRPLFRPGKTPLLVADGAISAGGFVPARKVAAKVRGGQSFQRTGTVAVFALVAEQPHANRVSIGSAIARAEAKMYSDFLREVGKLG